MTTGITQGVSWRERLGRRAAPVVLIAAACALAVQTARHIEHFPAAPQSIAIMECRIRFLADALAAYRETGVPLLASAGAGQYAPAGFSDDAGSYLYIPVLADALNVGVVTAVEYFYTTVIAASLIISAAGWLVYCRAWLARAVCLGMLSALATKLVTQSDVYVVPPAVLLATVPWILAVSRRAKADARLFAFVAGLAALACVANFARSHGGTPVLLFAGAVFLLDRSLHWKAKGGIVAAAILGYAVPSALIALASAERNEFLVRGGHRTREQVEAITGQHPLWHSVYIGLGYIENPLGIRYDDTVALNRVREIGGDGVEYLSPAYERILRDECFRITLNHPVFVAKCVLAKAYAVAKDFARFAHISLFALMLVPLPRRIAFAFLVTLAFCALPALLAVPVVPYLLAFWAASTMLAAAGLEQLVGRWIGSFGQQIPRLHAAAIAGTMALCTAVALWNGTDVGWSVCLRVASAHSAEQQAAASGAGAAEADRMAAAQP